MLDIVTKGVTRPDTFINEDELVVVTVKLFDLPVDFRTAEPPEVVDEREWMVLS